MPLRNTNISKSEPCAMHACCTNGSYLSLLYIDPANKHDLTIIKENEEDFVKRFKGNVVLLDKGYIDTEFAEETKKKGVKYIAIKRDNMLKDEKERAYHKALPSIRRIIETRFS